MFGFFEKKEKVLDSNFFIVRDINKEDYKDFEWLIGSDWKPVIRNHFGDIIILNKDDQVCFIDINGMAVEIVSQNIDEFWNIAMKNQEFFEDHFFPVAVLEFFKAHGMVNIDKETCLSYMRPLILGGKCSAENLHMTRLIVGVSSLGQIGFQTKDMEVGAKINLNIT